MKRLLSLYFQAAGIFFIIGYVGLNIAVYEGRHSTASKEIRTYILDES
jgi:hypothetical protein